MKSNYRLRRDLITDELKKRMSTLCEVEKPLEWWLNNRIVPNNEDLEEVITDVTPKINESINELDFHTLKELCQRYIDFVFSENYHEDNDYSVYIAETAIKMFFGENIYGKINKEISDEK